MAKREVLVLTCEKCGDDFLYDYKGFGKKPSYCESCKKIIRKETVQRAKQKYMAKTKQKALKVETKTETKVETKVVEQPDFAERLTKVLKELDNLRVEMCSLASDMQAYQSSYDKNDQTYLHRIEDIDVNNALETQKLIKEWKQSRNNRRNVKSLIRVLGDVIDVIPRKSYLNALPVIKGKDYNIR